MLILGGIPITIFIYSDRGEFDHSKRSGVAVENPQALEINHDERVALLLNR